MSAEFIPLPHYVICASNYRLQVAIQAVRVFGRTAETMCEVYDAKWSRLNIRGAYRNTVRAHGKALSDSLKAEATAIYAWQLTNAKRKATAYHAKQP